LAQAKSSPQIIWGHVVSWFVKSITKRGTFLKICWQEKFGSRKLPEIPLIKKEVQSVLEDWKSSFGHAARICWMPESGANISGTWELNDVQKSEGDDY